LENRLNSQHLDMF